MKNLIFYIGIATFFTHELDAVASHEWRVLPLTAWLPEQYGSALFILVHIPLFAAVIALLTSKNQIVQFRTRIGVCVFLLIHGLLHLLFMGNRNYEFTSFSANVLIFGGALLGMLYLLYEILENKRVVN